MAEKSRILRVLFAITKYQYNMINIVEKYRFYRTIIHDIISAAYMKTYSNEIAVTYELIDSAICGRKIDLNKPIAIFKGKYNRINNPFTRKDIKQYLPNEIVLCFMFNEVENGQEYKITITIDDTEEVEDKDICFHVIVRRNNPIKNDTKYNS